MVLSMKTEITMIRNEAHFEVNQKVADGSPDQTKKCYSRQDLEAFNLLNHPVWVFDIQNKAMWWANTSALKTVWSAESLEALLERNFSDMSAATERRLLDYLDRFEKGEQITDSWTFYPKGGGPCTVYCTMSGMYVEEGRMVMLNEAELRTTTETIDKGAVRDTELLRHLPVPVGQFNAKGKVMEQNPEALHVFGGNKYCDGSCELAGKERNPGCSLIDRFVDKEEGRLALEKVLSDGIDYSNQIEQYTKTGVRWFAVQMRRAKDPLTGEPVVLYSARDITAQVEANNNAMASALAKKEADEANMAKSEFVAVMGHEMRTPLHHVLGFLELIKGTELSPKQEEYLGLAETSASALMGVVNDLLDFTKLEAGKMPMERLSTNICDVATASVKVLESKVAEKGLKLNTYIDSSIPHVIADPVRIRQVLFNFLGNALKFTSEGEITLSVRRLHTDENDRVVIHFSVQDTGIGIDPEQQSRIFSKYQQANPSIARNYGGTGLGLAICKVIVDTLGGSIGLESDTGRGSRFWFQISFDQAPCITEHVNSISENEEYASLHVLVAEDNKVNQKLMASFLRRLGHTFTIVDNGLLAVEAIEQEKYDLILMDIQMPVMDGLDATQLIRKNGWSMETLPILGLTAEFHTKNHEKFLAIGMNDCVGKPIRLDNLKKYLQV
jgi:signal transduction histidine kinase